jgi:hypothetical protein
MHSDPIFQLSEIVSKLIGTTCWQVGALGSVAGSHFILDFGRKIEWPMINDRYSEVLPRYHGEFGLQVGSASWRIDDKVKPITSSDDLSTLNGPMITGLRLLKGCVVTAANITQPGMDLFLDFNNVYSLKIFCDLFDESYDNYSVSFIDTYICITGRSKIIVKRGNDPA